MKFNKGQALLEFLLILPIFLTMFIGMVDFGRIFYEKSRLENIMGDVIDMLYVNRSVEEIMNHIELYYGSGIEIVLDNHNNNTIVILTTGVDTYTPGLEYIFSKPFLIETTRVIYNES